MKSILIPLTLLVVGLHVQANTPAQVAPNQPKGDVSFEYRFDDTLRQTPDSLARQEKWFRDAKYGAFIHFGAYSPLEGEFEGRGNGFRYSEWIQISARMSSDEYHAVAKRFNPHEFDADEWAQTFKDTGLKYVVITSKHHDGFALFDSMVSYYNVADYTPFKRDIIRELNEACHRQGLKFGVYYSHAQDWDQPDAPYLSDRPKRSIIHPDLISDFEPEFERYLTTKSLPQVEELMKNYELDLIWFDTPVEVTFEIAKRFTDVVRKYRPDCLINSRIIHRGKGKIEAKNLELFDYVSIGDKEVPTRKLPLYVESPDSVSSSFGYKTKGRHFYHTEQELIHRLIDTVCAGGNYLLNNGPMGNGRLDPEAVKRYRAIGEWLKVNGEAIYGTARNPLPAKPDWGNVSVSKDGLSLYLHVFEWPEDSRLAISSPSLKVQSVVLLDGNDAISFTQKGSMVELVLPKEAVDKDATVIKLSLSEAILDM